jgi:hypothetical protein
MIASNIAMLKSWTKVQARVSAIPTLDHIEVELPGTPDPTVVVLSATHSLGLDFNRTVPVYVDPHNATGARFGGLLQMWLWPSALTVGAVLGVILAITFARAGSGEIGNRWHISPPPPPFQSEITVRPPISESRAPLFWALLGVGALAAGVLSNSSPIPTRVGLSLVGTVFILGMLEMSLESRTMQIRADSQRIRKSTAFGWIEVPWTRVAHVERRIVIPDERTPGYFLSRELPFPGRKVESYVFLDEKGWTLFSMSIGMGPAEAMYQLLALCRQQTGSTIDTNTIRSPLF